MPGKGSGRSFIVTKKIMCQYMAKYLMGVDRQLMPAVLLTLLVITQLSLPSEYYIAFLSCSLDCHRSVSKPGNVQTCIM